MVIACAALFLVAPSLWAANKATDEENAILALVLTQSYPDGGYTIVERETEVICSGGKECEQSIAEHIQTNGIVVTGLVDRLLDRNKKPVQLTLKSSATNGY